MTFMAYARRSPKYRWRDHLSEAEERRVIEIEEAQKQTAQMRLDLVTIRNRASQRALRAAAKRSK